MKCPQCGAKVKLRAGTTATSVSAQNPVDDGDADGSAPAPIVDDLLPPSVTASAATASAPKVKPRPASTPGPSDESSPPDDLLPPMVDGSAPAASAVVDETLLPPGAVDGDRPARRALPAESLPRDFLAPPGKDSPIVIPTANGDVRITPKKKTVVIAGQERELHELSRDEREGRRTVTNLVVLGFCVVVLLVVLGLLYLLVRRPG